MTEEPQDSGWAGDSAEEDAEGTRPLCGALHASAGCSGACRLREGHPGSTYHVCNTCGQRYS